MFTGDAEARLRQYTSDPRHRAKSVDLTLAQLEALKSQVGMQLGGARPRLYNDCGDEENNMVTVNMDKIKQAIADGRFKPPANSPVPEQ